MAEQAAKLVNVGSMLIGPREAVDAQDLRGMSERALFAQTYAAALQERGRPVTDGQGIIVRFRP